MSLRIFTTLEVIYYFINYKHPTFHWDTLLQISVPTPLSLPLPLPVLLSPDEHVIETGEPSVLNRKEERTDNRKLHLRSFVNYGKGKQWWFR